MVVQRILAPFIKVRILASEPLIVETIQWEREILVS